MIEFPNQLSVITGETGAGKSILMGALSLILGERADSSVLLNREKKCIVEGIFQIADRPEVLQLVEDAELDPDKELIVRREIAVNGKSRAFVNDTPVTLQLLRELTMKLVDLHRQFDMQELGDTTFQLQVLDALAVNSSLLIQYRSVYQRLQAARQKLNDLAERKNRAANEYGYNQFLFDELHNAAFQPDELEELDKEVKLLSNSEAIKNTLNKVLYELSGEESPMVQQLKSMYNQLNYYASYHPALPAICERLHSTHIELDDLSAEIENLNVEIVYDAGRIEFINQRIHTGYKLLKKHNMTTTAELLHLQDQLSDRLQKVLNIDESLESARREEQQLFSHAETIASKLSQKREATVEDVENKVNKLLKQVGMPNARIKVQVGRQPLKEDGADIVEFLFDANKSNRFESIRKVASGGELSRLMLCIKSLIAERVNLPTLIFDEIDSGISGEAARQVGLILKDLAIKRQVLCITHQPQIAGKATSHFLVYKEIRSDQIHTSIRLLDQDERVTVIAKMLSGEKPTAAAIANAKEMVLN